MLSFLLLYALLAAGLIATLFLFVSLKREIHARRATPPPPPPEIVVIAGPPRSGPNITKRVHALRMLRRGEDVAHIAAALSIPRREVELMIRVHQFSHTQS